MSVTSLPDRALRSTHEVLSFLHLSIERRAEQRQREKSRKQHAKHLTDALKPLPTVRARSLTLPLPADSASGTKRAQRTGWQTQSRLFSMLPPELRMRIYTALFADQDIFVLKDERLRYVKWLPSKHPLLPLLLTCRRVYSEAIDLLYSHTHFNFNDYDTIVWFGSTVLPQRLNLVRFLSVQWDCICFWLPNLRVPPPYDRYTWFKVWDLIASMQGLRELRVKVWNGPRMNRQTEIDVFSPLRELKHLKVFEVELSWKLARENEDDEDENDGEDDPHVDAPYKVSRVRRDYATDDWNWN
ncbi:hypothetical protein AJ80_01064 [Polytolypa hystricis UAMH7299]|uniref:DUF7730 domain-containing protein n=1 Tax=Polytolypa hystricis (strain UAMH7299) TaxID=1447883 RepID=A0A2B7Z2Q8_POLH7|nr:hypothetical protein AJ80_01064 [Polytolypa hystricis UAMH7299]